MRTAVVVGAVALVALVGGAAMATQDSDSACDRYAAAVERDDYASFEEQQREQAVTLAECMEEKDKSAL